MGCLGGEREGRGRDDEIALIRSSSRRGAADIDRSLAPLRGQWKKRTLRATEQNMKCPPRRIQERKVPKSDIYVTFDVKRRHCRACRNGRGLHRRGRRIAGLEANSTSSEDISRRTICSPICYLSLLDASRRCGHPVGHVMARYPHHRQIEVGCYTCWRLPTAGPGAWEERRRVDRCGVGKGWIGRRSARTCFLRRQSFAPA